MRLAALALVAACGGQTGTIKVSLATAPSSHVLDTVATLRMTLTNPPEVVEATRGPNGFDLAIDLPAQGIAGALIIEALDDGGTLIACGQSPQFPISAISSAITVYMAAPRSIAAAPVELEMARSQLAATAVSFGVAIAGGRDGTGALTDSFAVYSAYSHTLGKLPALPEARSGLAIGTGVGNAVLMFGGTGPTGAPASTLWRFTMPSEAAPGSFTLVADDASVARTGQTMLSVGTEQFLISGAPPLALSQGVLTARTDVAMLPTSGAATTVGDTPTAAFDGSDLVLFKTDQFATLGVGRPGASISALPGGRFLVAGGGEPLTRDALLIDGGTGMITTLTNALVTPRRQPSITATARHVVIAGGTDGGGAPVATAEVLDAATLAPIVTQPIAARTGMIAVPLATDQVLLVGGDPASTLIELFTPEPPPH